MERNDMLIGRSRAKYLSAVSGGSYIATAFAMVATGRIKAAAEQGDPSIDPDKDPPKDGHPDMRPFARGTPEERYLRGHTLYLTHGRGGVPGAIWRVLVGLMFNLTLVALTIAALAIPLGWFYGWAWPSLQAGCPDHCPSAEPFAVPSGLWWAVIATAIAATVSGYVWLAVRFRTRWVRTVWGAVSGTLAVGALALLLFGIGIPELIALARPHTTTQAVPASAQTVKSTTVAATSVGLFALFVSWVVVVRKVVARPTSLEKGVVKALRGFTARHRSFLIDVVAFLAGPVLVLALMVVFAYVGSAHQPGWSDGGHR
jgi:hypothetical protein